MSRALVGRSWLGSFFLEKISDLSNMRYMIIDTHSHLNFNAYKDDLEEVLKRTAESDIQVINVGSQYETSKRAVEIAEKYQGNYAAVGLHPIHITKDLIKVKSDQAEIESQREEFDKEKYRELAKSSKVKAIGEIGLDYYYRPKTKQKTELFKEKQKKIFLEQLDLALELSLPVIFHCRMAQEDLIKILNSQIALSYKKIRGVIHCFTGSVEDLNQYLNLGLYIGFNGIIFKLDLDEAIKQCPLDRMLLETDCPYLTPPQEGDKRNEPFFIKHAANRIAELKGLSYEEILKANANNANQLFSLWKK